MKEYLFGSLVQRDDVNTKSTLDERKGQVRIFVNIFIQ